MAKLTLTDLTKIDSTAITANSAIEIKENVNNMTSSVW